MLNLQKPDRNEVYYEYLDLKREQGRISMLTGSDELKKAFKLKKEIATDVFRKWIKFYDDEE